MISKNMVLNGYLKSKYLKNKIKIVENIAARAIVVKRTKKSNKEKVFLKGNFKYVEEISKNPINIPVTFVVEKKPTLFASVLHQ